jgi:hypothetical protein
MKNEMKNLKYGGATYVMEDTQQAELDWQGKVKQAMQRKFARKIA